MSCGIWTIRHFIVIVASGEPGLYIVIGWLLNLVNIDQIRSYKYRFAHLKLISPDQIEYFIIEATESFIANCDNWKSS